MKSIFKKVRSIKRAEKLGDILILDKNYALQSLNLILSIVEDIISELRNKYEKFTLLTMLLGLWRFTFSNTMIKLENFAVLNHEKDVFDGPFKDLNFVSSSEQIFLEVWRAQRSRIPINNFSLVGLDSRNINKMSFLVAVFGELRMAHW